MQLKYKIKVTIISLMTIPHYTKHYMHEGKIILIRILYYLQTFQNTMSDCCLMPTQQFFSYIMARTS